MELQAYRAEDLFEWVTGEGHDFTLLDVRNNEEFGRFKVEGPHQIKMINVPYMEFIEKEDESVAQVQIPKEESIRIVCAKEGSAKYVGEILVNHGWKDVRYLAEVTSPPKRLRNRDTYTSTVFEPTSSPQL